MPTSKLISVVEPEVVEASPIVRYRSLAPWSFKDKVVGIAALISVSGLLLLAVIDENYRSSFVTFANTFVAAYVGVQVSKRR